ncbi:hypothetical protein AYO42_05360 [Rhizomicrobium sp. SCGC AG-212-E05]|nr:hypothetical protein AYO42_05360 [Rhizomicrobium sp. SCGC AG-212-E05]
MARGVREAVRIADDVRRSTPFLSTLVGGDLRGMLRRAAVMWRLGALCRSGDLPFDATEVQVENAPVHLLSIQSGKTELHIVRTDEPEGFPVDAQVRQDRRASNTADLFEDGKIIPLHKALEAVPSLYGWLTWGATPKGDVTHVCLGMPEHDDNAWLAHIDVLKHVTASERGKAETSKTSAPDPTLMLRFREEIAHSLEQQSGGERGEAG